MTHEEVKQFFERLVKSKVQCQLTPGILMEVEDVDLQLDEEKRLHVLITVGDEEWNDNFELIFPAEAGDSKPSAPKGRGGRGGK